MWSWIREVLGLVGNELIIFSFIFSQTFDGTHKCYTNLSQMEDWFGITRQTISRNIESLSEKKYIIKRQCCNDNDNDNAFIKHNHYYVNIDYITKLCEESDYDNYLNFLDSYRLILKQKFPEDSTKIDEYLKELSSWHQNKESEICITLNDLSKLLYTNNEQENNISKMLGIIDKQKKDKKFAEKEYIEKDPSKRKEITPKRLIEKPKEKRKSKKAIHAEWDATKKEMSESFVFIHAGGDSELQNLLYSFLETQNGKSYTPVQWEQQLENLYRYGRTTDRMIEGVRNSFMNNYRSLYIHDKNEVDIDLKIAEIQKYVINEAEDNAELKEYLESYVIETPKGKSATIKQFRLKLTDLTRLCPTTQQKIDSVKLSYMNSYASLAYTSTLNNTPSDSPEIDMEEKKIAIKSFIESGCYYLKPDIEKYLTMYLENTSSGKSMTIDSFKIILDNIRLYCLDDNDKIAKLKAAIQNNSSKVATEDFAESNKIKAKFQTREGIAKSNDNNRKNDFVKEKRRNPNNPLIKDIPMPKFY